MSRIYEKDIRAKNNPVLNQILDGDLDELLQDIEHAMYFRKRNRFRKGSQVRLVNTRNPSLDGQVGTILKINAKTITVRVGGDPAFKHATERELDAMDMDTLKAYLDSSEARQGREYNVPQAMLEPVA